MNRLILCLGLVGVMPIWAQCVATPITAGPGTTYIDEPGNYYLATAGESVDDLDPLIVIRSNYVNLDLNGLVLSNANQANRAAAIVVSEYSSVVSVENGSISGFSTGVRFNEFGAHHRARNLTILRCVTGMEIRGGSAIEIRGNRIALTADPGQLQPSAGIRVNGDRHLITENTIVGGIDRSEISNHYGMVVDSGASQIRIVANDIVNLQTGPDGSGAIGIWFNAVEGGMVVGNRLMHDAQRGIDMRGSDGKYRDNLVGLNVTNDYLGGYDAGNND